MANTTAAPPIEHAPVTQAAFTRRAGGFVVLAPTR